MRILVSLLLLLAACSSNEKPEPAPAPPLFGGDTCNDAVCGAFYGAMLAVTLASTPVNAAERRMTARRITGTCEVQLPQMKGKDACHTVLLTITGTDGKPRRAWIDGHEFEVDHLKNGPFTVLAESEEFGVNAKLENVRVGSRIAVQLSARPRTAWPK